VDVLAEVAALGIVSTGAPLDQTEIGDELVVAGIGRGPAMIDEDLE
jgi:hypothetical protein